MKYQFLVWTLRYFSHLSKMQDSFLESVEHDFKCAVFKEAITLFVGFPFPVVCYIDLCASKWSE